MNAQEYELAFVTDLPAGIRVVEPSTLDFSKNPAGALAFRYKHGWILINPLIPSRGMSGGGLARQHGHISGGFTTGHFERGADGKMHFKAVNRYADKSDWQKEIKKVAEGVGAKQEAVKKAVDKAENASNAAQKLEDSGASKVAQASAHKLAADAHMDAAKAFQAAGEGPAHKAGALTHNAHSAIHEAKSAELVKAAQAEAEAAKLEKAKAEAKGLGATAGELSAKAKGAEGLPKETAALHQEAAAAHKAAQVAHEGVGAKYTAEAHGKAAALHEQSAARQLEEQKKLEHAAGVGSAKAFQETLNAKSAEGGSLEEQLKAHKNALEAHGDAAELHSHVGNAEVAQEHLKQKGVHETALSEVTQKKAKQDALEAAHEKAVQEADKASLHAASLGNTPEAYQAHKDAAHAYTAAKKAAQAAGLPEEGQDHHENAVAHLAKAAEVNKHLGLKAENDQLKAKANEAYQKAVGMPSATPEEMQAKADAFQEAADKAGTAGYHAAAHGLPKDTLNEAKASQSKDMAASLKAKAETAKQAAEAKTAESQALSKKAYKASETVNKAPESGKAAAHLVAAQAHTEAAQTAHDAGLPQSAAQHKEYAALHQADAKKLQAAEEAATAAKAAEIPAPPVQTGGVKKPVGKLTGTGKQLGSHDNEVMVDEAGNHWLKKNDDYSRVLDPALASLQRKTGLRTPVFVKTKTGHLQKMLPGSKPAFPNGNFDPEKLSEQDITKMLQHQVLDWATGNQDTHSGQWLKTKSGDLVQIDQGQAFKHGVGKGDPTKTYPPLGQDTPVYPKLWNAAKAGKIQIPDPNGDNEFAHTIKAIQSMPDDQFKALFKPYAEQAMKNGHNPGGHATVDGFLNDIVQHKNSIGKDFEKLYNGLPESAKSSAEPKAGKEDALKAISEHAAGGHLATLEQIKAAKDAGASLKEIYEAGHPAENKAPESLSAKDEALKQLAEHANGSHGGAAEGGKLMQQAKAAGASGDEITKALANPGEMLKSLGHAPSTSASGLTPKQEALKAVANYAHNPPDNWSVNHFQHLKNVAHNQGASPAEMKEAQYAPEKFLKSLPVHTPAEPVAHTPSAPAAPAKPQVDPFKPKAKWTKTEHSIATADGEHAKAVPGLQGPKGLVVHKDLTGKGWQVTTSDGVKVPGTGGLKTQKEAKLAAEWMAKNFTGSQVTKDTWVAHYSNNPEAHSKLKNGLLGKQWNKDAQAELDKIQGKTPPPVPTAPSAPKVSFTGLTNDKVANAALLKKLYDQAHGPNATAADKAEYAKAQDAWKSKHSSGPFDPAKYIAPGHVPPLGFNSNPQANKPKYPVKKGHEGWKPYNPAEGSTHGLATTDRTKLAEITKQQWSQSTYDLGYRSASFNESLHGDWKPPYEDAGPGSGPFIYSTGHYTSINQQLRGEVKQGIAPIGPKGGKWDTVIDHMDKAFQDVPPLDRNVVVSRKMWGSGPFPDAPPPMKPGEVYLDHGYNSTSKSREVWSGNVHMEIRLPKGSKVLDLNHSYGSDNSTEQEVLLNRESKFKVIEDTSSTWHGNKVRHIVVELVP